MQFDDEEQPRQTSADDRKERRWNIPIPVRVRGERPDGTEFDATSITADASASGMCLLLTESPRHGSQVQVIAPEEQFESPARVTIVSSLGSNLNRIRVRFIGSKLFDRTAAAKKYAYDYQTDSWIGYFLEGIYYNSKHEPFGKLEGPRVVSVETGKDLFILRWDNLYDLRGNCIAHLV